MTDPFAPFPARPKEPPNNARLPVARFKALGVSNVVIAEAERRWLGASAQEREEARMMFEAATDDELRRDAIELEFTLALEAALGEPKPDDWNGEALYPVEYLDDALAHNDGTVDEARAWVEDSHEGHPSDRALAMLVAERRRADTEQRKTLIAPLEARVRGEAHASDDH